MTVRTPKVERFDQSKSKHYDKELCSEVIHKPSPYIRGRLRDGYCQLSAAWRVDGKLYCTRHAGERVLRALETAETGPENSRDEMSPKENGTLDFSSMRFATAHLEKGS